LYDANALLEWLNSVENARGAVFQPAFELNFVPTVDRHEARALHGPATDDVRFENARIYPCSAKPEIAMLVRHLPDPMVHLTTRRLVHEQQDTRHIVGDCLRIIAAMATTPEAELAELDMRPLPAIGRLLRGHQSGVAVDLEMTRALAMSVPEVDSCDLETCPNGRAGGVRIRARLRGRRLPDVASLAA
jgi:hypothetical protein